MLFRSVTFDANDFHFRKLQLRASMAGPAIYFPAVLELMKAGVIPGDELISHRFPMAEIEPAMLTNRDNKKETVKIVVNP